MSTAFFWDKEQKEFICERRAWDLDFCGRRTYLFVFNSPNDLIKLLTEKRDRIVYDEYGIMWTVDLLRYDVLNRGIVVFCSEYWKGDVAWVKLEDLDAENVIGKLETGEK